MAIDLTKRVLAGLTALQERLHLVKVETHHCPQFAVNTVAGILFITPMDDWLACRFEDVTLATKHLRTHDEGGHLNPYSGKWNWHWFNHMPQDCQDQTRLNMESGIDNMLHDFAFAIEDLLPVTSGQQTPQG